MKSNTKIKPRHTSLSVLRSIEKKVSAIARYVEPMALLPIEFPTNSDRFIKLDASGKPLPMSAKEWAAVRDTKLDLDWSAQDVGAAMPWSDAKAACEKLDLCGTKNWRLPTVEELFLLADRTRREPAIDVAMFPTRKSNWYWTSTPRAGYSDFAWIVDFSSGYSGSSSRGLRSYVRACRSRSSCARTGRIDSRTNTATWRTSRSSSGFSHYTASRKSINADDTGERARSRRAGQERRECARGCPSNLDR